MLNSIRGRLTVWYVLVFGSLLVGFSAYIYSELSIELTRQFDEALLRSAKVAVNHFTQTVEHGSDQLATQSMLEEVRLGEARAALFRNGALLASTNQEVSNTIVATRILSKPKPDDPPYVFTEFREDRLVAHSFDEGGTRYSIVLLQPMDRLIDQLRRIRHVIFVGLPTALALAAVSGYFLAKSSFRPVVTISRQAEHISARNLQERIEIRNPQDELGQLATVFNALLGRLDDSFRLMREFMADASHELRTPLAIIHGEADVSLAQDRIVSSYKDSLTIIRTQSKRMTRIVRDMLALARADAGQQRLQLEELYLNDLVGECCHAANAIAEPKGVKLNFEPTHDIQYLGDEEMLKRMVVNLLDNAIHYTFSGGCVTVELTSYQSCVELVVRDTGIGIPPDCVGRVFDRFYRVESLPTRVDGGSGLGLSIVKLAAEAHRGSVSVVSQPGRGSTFTVSLPL